MSQDTRIPAGEPGLREESDPKRRDASREPAQEQEPREDSAPREPQEGVPGYGEPPPEVRREKLPDQGW